MKTRNSCNHKFIAAISTTVLLLLSGTLSAQDPGRYVVKAGQSIQEVITFDRMYKYPAFVPGEIVYKNGTFNKAVMNYNYVIAEIQFVTGRDTFSIANAKTLDFITMSGDTFIYEDGYMMKVLEGDQINLYEKQYIKLVNVKKKGAYGISSATAHTDNLSFYTVNSGGMKVYQLELSEDHIFSKIIEYYIVVDNQEVVPAKRSNVLKLFPDRKSEIKKFIKDHSIKFDNQEALLQLCDFLDRLENA